MAFECPASRKLRRPSPGRAATPLFEGRPTVLLWTDGGARTPRLASNSLGLRGKMSMSTGRGDTRASRTGHGQRPRATDAELASADFKVADARAHVERWTRHVEDELRRGSPAMHSREILA